VYESPNVNDRLARAIKKTTGSGFFSFLSWLGPAPVYLHLLDLHLLYLHLPGARLAAHPPGVLSSTIVLVSFVAVRLAVYRRSFVIA
jgi:hypothetical protein